MHPFFHVSPSKADSYQGEWKNSFWVWRESYWFPLCFGTQKKKLNSFVLIISYACVIELDFKGTLAVPCWKMGHEWPFSVGPKVFLVATLTQTGECPSIRLKELSTTTLDELSQKSFWNGINCLLIWFYVFQKSITQTNWEMKLPCHFPILSL